MCGYELITINLTRGKMIFHPCLSSVYENLTKVCGLSGAQDGEFVYLSDNQEANLKALSSECPFLGTTFMNTINVVGDNGISGGIIATLTSDANLRKWIMLHIHRFGRAETDTKYGINKNEPVIKEDILALSATAPNDINSVLLQRLHADYCDRYTFDSVYKSGFGSIERGIKMKYTDFTNNSLCCDVVKQPLNGVTEMLSCIDQI